MHTHRILLPVSAKDATWSNVYYTSSTSSSSGKARKKVAWSLVSSSVQSTIVRSQMMVMMTKKAHWYSMSSVSLGTLVTLKTHPIFLNCPELTKSYKVWHACFLVLPETTFLHSCYMYSVFVPVCVFAFVVFLHLRRARYLTPPNLHKWRGASDAAAGKLNLLQIFATRQK